MHEQSETRRNPYGSFYNRSGLTKRRLRPNFSFERDFYDTQGGAVDAAALRSSLSSDPRGPNDPRPSAPSFRQDPYGPAESYLRTSAPMGQRESLGDFDPALLSNPIVRTLLASRGDGREAGEPIQPEQEESPVMPFSRPYSGREAIKAMLMRRAMMGSR